MLNVNEPIAGGARDLILSQVHAAPGFGLTELRRATGIVWSTLYYHVARLEKAGRVRTEKRGRVRVVYPAGLAGAERLDRLRGDARTRVARAVARLGPVTVERVVAETALTPRVVYYHLKSLRDEGFVERDRWTRTLTATPRLRACLAREREILA